MLDENSELKVSDFCLSDVDQELLIKKAEVINAVGSARNLGEIVDRFTDITGIPCTPEMRMLFVVLLYRISELCEQNFEKNNDA